MKIYTDGSCLGNPGSGGWASIGLNDGDAVSFKLCGGDLHTTNNIMEMTAIIRGLERYGGGPVEIYTDSKYVMDGITKWIHGWRQRGWRTAAGTEVKNRVLWEKLDSLMTPFVTFQWVKAHNGDRWNEEADRLAKRTAELVKQE